MAAVNVYLTFDGDCREAFEMYQKVFGVEIPYMGTFGEMPPQEGYELPEADKNKIMHVTLPVSQETSIMGSDITGQHREGFKMGNNFAISINANSKEEADHLFAGLADGGKVTMAMEATFWGAYFGMLTDKFGVNWMVNYDDPAKMQQHP